LGSIYYSGDVRVGVGVGVGMYMCGCVGMYYRIAGNFRMVEIFVQFVCNV